MEKVAISPARVMRIIWFGFVLSAAMLIYVMFVIPVQAAEPAGVAIEAGITIIALVDVVLGFLAPRFMARFASPIREGRQGAAALSAWLSRNLVGIALIYSCTLFAFVLHMLRARPDLVEMLFAAGIVSLLLWQPGAPPVIQPGKIAKR